MFAIRARRKVASERDFLDAVEKVVRQGTKFSSTYVLSLAFAAFFHRICEQAALSSVQLDSCISSIIISFTHNTSDVRLLLINNLTWTRNGGCTEETTMSLTTSSAVVRTVKSASSSLRTTTNLSCSPLSRRTPYFRTVPQPPGPELGELLSKYASLTLRPLDLSTLLSLGRPLTAQSVLASVKCVLLEIPHRLATRVRSIEALPFIVGTNPYVANILQTHRDSFRWLATHPPITNIVDNAKFAQQLADLVRNHANDIPTMAKG